MKCKKLLGLQSSVLLLALAWSSSASAQWTGANVGTPTHKGSVVTNANSSLSINGGGDDIWNATSDFYYYYTWASGQSWSAGFKVDKDIVGGDPAWAKCELLVDVGDKTAGPKGSDAFLAMMYTKPSNVHLCDQYRAAASGSSDEYTTPGLPTYQPPVWMNITRVGSVFHLFYSLDGNNWSDYLEIDTAGNSWVGNDNGVYFGEAFPDQVAVGVAVTAHNDADTVGATATVSGLFMAPIAGPTAFGISSQPKNASNHAGCEVSFSLGTTNNSAQPSIVTYQWHKNGTVISGATASSFSYVINPVDPSENNAQVFCIASIAPPNGITWPSVPAPLTSATVSVSVLPGVTYYTNGVKIERFAGATRADLETNNIGAASSIRVSTRDGSASPLNYTGFENLPDDGINYNAERLSGWFLPPTTGSYVFFITGDDDSDLFLSTDNNPLHKQLIAQEQNWANQREWLDDEGGGISDTNVPAIFMKRSDTWTNSDGTAPWASGIPLTAGTPYYIEADHHQGTGGENVGVFAKLVSSPDPTNGTPPIPASQLFLASYPATTLTWAIQPQSSSAFENAGVTFTASATSDSEFSVLYQWQRNGTNLVGATTSTYSIGSAIIADNGAKFSVVAATAEGGLSITSAPVTLTVQQAAFEKGLALMQYWANTTALPTPAGTPPPGTPTFSMAVPAFEAGVNNENGSSYVNELSGFFIPAVTGTYDFICTSDDDSMLFLSTDANPNNKRLICQEPNWSNPLTWGTDSDGAAQDLVQKHSATWTNASGVALWANGFSLTAGTRYYIELWHHEGSGGDNCAATFTMRTGGAIAPDPADGTDSAIKGNLLGFNTPAASYMAFSQQPASVTVISGTSATFAANGTSDGQLPIGTTGIFYQNGAFLTFPTVVFQWYRNGTQIPGATTSTYTTPALKPADNNAQYVAAIRALGYPTWSNSTPAVVTVITDTNKPTAYAAVFDQNPSLPVISVGFSKMMDPAAISDMSHYSVSGGGAAIVGIIVDTNDLRHVQLQLAAQPTGPVTLTLTGVTDFSGNALVSSTLSVATLNLTNQDIGDFTVPDPAWPGYMFADGPGALTVMCQGSDIWNAGDGFNFSYETKTGDFDVAVRHVSFTKVSNWSKGGLMVREDLTPGSRNWNIVNDPTSADGVNAIDGSGNGANTVESNCRSTNDQASVSWATGPATVPAYPDAWVRIKRTGQLLQAFWSTNADGSGWTMEAATDVSTNINGPLPASLYVGVACTAHNNNSTSATDLNYYYSASFANYNSSYVPPTNSAPAKLSAAVSGGNIVVSWTPAGGTLQSSPTLGSGAAWTKVGTANPATVQLSGNAKFFRVGP